MMKIHDIAKLSLIVGLVVLISCNTNKEKKEPVTEEKNESVWSDLPEVTNLDSLHQTDFAITLENPIAENKNIIYAPAFLYAWDKVKEKLASAIVLDKLNSPDFGYLNKSTSYQNSLSDSEYSATADIIGDAIIAKAFFNKTLPFESKMQEMDKPLYFDKTKVSAFGMCYYDEDVVKFTRILYYKDDDHFILKLTPKDKQQEIILSKGIGQYQSLNEAIKKVNELIVQGKKDQKNESLLWKFQLRHYDIFVIPTIKFNIATGYNNIIGQKFITKDNKTHSVEEAYQRTGFILNENGAVVESDAVAAVDSFDASPQRIVTKKMIFDKPFLIIIKSIDKPNPYFVMKVENAELLTKQ